jgi:adenosylcobinamide-GDP ribazoletransferase
VKHLLAAIRFITVVPVGSSTDFDPAGMRPWFPVVGLLLGMAVAATDRLWVTLWPDPTAALLDVVMLAAASGALHLDGLGDTADGLYGRRPARRALEIMKDSRIGAMGVIAILGCLAVKWVGIAGLHEQRALVLVLVPAYARAAILFGMRFLPYGRPEGGTGSAFFRSPIGLGDFWALLPVIGLSFWLGWTGVVINLVFAVGVAGILAFYRRKLGCITGDMLGALTEVSEALLFLAASASIRSVL